MSQAIKQFDDNMTGILGTNDYKKEDKHPDKRGRCKIHGIWFWVSGWTKTANGRTFDSLSFTEMTVDEAKKVEDQQAAKRAPQTSGGFGTQGQQAPQTQTQAQAQSQQANIPPAQNPDGTPHASAQPSMDFDDDIPF